MIKDSKILYFILIFAVGYFFGNLQYAAILLSLGYIVNLFISSNNTIAFREYTLAIYAINYLLSPAILYAYNDADFIVYKMNCPIDTYFTNSISGIFALHLGVFFLKTTVFNTNFTVVKIEALLNEKVLRSWVMVGIGLYFIYITILIPAELAFFVVLLSGLRYVGVFGLLSINPKKNIYLILAVVVFEVYVALVGALFHDLMVWTIFFGLYFVFIKKVPAYKKVLAGMVLIFLGFMVQNIKADYREKIWRQGEESEVDAFSNVASSKAQNTDALFSMQNVLVSLVRLNQGWIAASTIDNMDKTQRFAGTEVLYTYIEAALLPRFLAPNKLKSGDKEIFNKYSGHTIREGTSMGLGIIADGYVAYAYFGVIIFCFGLGLIFSLVFKIVEKWSRVSPFFILMLFPVLYYAVRPDCELQTTLGHLVKGTFTYWLVVRYYASYFKAQTKVLQKIEEFKNALLERRKSQLI